MNTIKVSIITVTFNSKSTIRRTIESVINQTYDNIEYIIIDGGSTDGTLLIIEEYADKIDYFVSEKDNGIYDAFNKGIKASSGDIIGIINSDDWYTFDAVEQSVDALLKNDAEMCCGNAIMVENEMILRISKSNLMVNPWYGCQIIHPSVFVRRKLYNELGMFDTKYSIASDYKWMLEVMINNKRIYHIDKETVYFRRGGISTTQRFQTAYETYRVIRELFNLYSPSDINMDNILQFWKNKVSRIRGEEILDMQPDKVTDELRKRIPNNELVVWGAGNYGRRITKLLKDGNIAIPYVVDSDPAKRGMQLFGKNILDPSVMLEDENKVFIAIDKSKDELLKYAFSYGIDPMRVITLPELFISLCSHLF